MNISIFIPAILSFSFFLFAVSSSSAQCTAPSGLSASAPTVSGATLNWTENGTATLWDIEIQPAGTAATGTPTVSGVTKPYTWTGGNQGTNYQAWVRSNCGGSNSDWVGPVAFRTYINNANPACVNLSLPVVNACDWFPIEVSGLSGNTLGADIYLDKVEVIIAHYWADELDIYLETPSNIQVELSTDNGSFGENYGGSCSSQTATFAMWATTPVTAAGVAPIIGAYQPEGNFASFNGANPNGIWELAVCDDDYHAAGTLQYVRLYFTTCPRPSSLSASNPTINGATLNWTENGTATTWDIEIQPVGTPATGVPTVSGVSKPYTWTGGSQATTYQVWVRSNCGGSNSEWSSSTATFQTTIDNAAPACVNYELPAQGCSNTIPITVSGAPGNTLGTDVFLDRVEVILHHGYVGELDIYLETPSGVQIPLSTGNGGEWQNYGGTCSTQTTTFAMWASTPVTAGSAPFIGTYRPEGNFATFNGANPNGNWTLAACDNNFFGFGFLKYVRLHFTTCPRPSSLSASSPSISGATLNWTENGTATLWDIEIQPAGTAATGTPTVSGVTKPYTWTGGNQGTNYQAWVRSNCGGSNSDWVGPVAFRTYINNANPACVNLSLPVVNACDWFPIEVSGLPGNALGADIYLDKAEVIVAHNRADELDIYLETPSNIQIELSTDNGSYGQNYGGNCSSQTATFAMWETTPVTAAGVAPIIGAYQPEGNFASFNGANPNGIWELAVCDDGNHAIGTLQYVRLYFTTCPRPNSLSASNPTLNGATLNWTENGTATTWDIEIQPVGTPATGVPTVSGVSKPYTWTGGSQATTYQVWVRSNCGGSNSEWFGTTTFSTIIDNANPACVNYTLPAYNACAWFPTAVSGAPGTTLGADVFLDKVEVIIEHNEAEELDIYLETPSNIQIQLSTDNGGYGNNYGGNCSSETTTFAMWATTPVTAGATPFIGTYRPEGNFASFNGANPNGNWELAVCDDGPYAVGALKYVRLHFTDCPRPSDFTAGSITPNGATLNWTEIGPATTWDLEIQPAGSSATGTPTVSGVTKPFVWTGGNPATVYQVWLRGICGGGASEWSGPFTFQTAIDNASPSCFDYSLPSYGCVYTLPISVSGAPGNTLGTDVFLDKVEVILHHNTVSQLEIFLETPAGASIALTSYNGGSGDNYGGTCSAETTTFATWASTPISSGAAPFIGNYIPQESFSLLNGNNPNGNWQLSVCDIVSSVSGSLKYARLTFASSLPVTLASFTAKPTDARQVLLEWATESEQNSAWFVVERSVNGTDFAEIMRVQSAGNSTGRQRYESLDEQPFPGINYYRLRMIDQDGTFEYSPIRPATLPEEDQRGLKIYPNPAQGSFFVEPRGETGELLLLAPNGHVVRQNKISEGNNVQAVSTSGLPAGLYWLRFRTASGSFTSKLVIQ